MKQLRLEAHPFGSGPIVPPSRPTWPKGTTGTPPPDSRFHLRVFIPSLDRRGRRLPPGSLVPAVERLILAISDGSTMIRGRGSWRADDGRIVSESVTVCESFVPRDLPPTSWNNFFLALRALAHEWGQEAILAVIDGRPILISGTRSPARGRERATMSVVPDRWNRGLR